MAVTTLERATEGTVAMDGVGRTVPTEDRTLVITRLLDAPRALVWKLWSDPVHIVRWWGPPGCQNSECALIFEVGGAFRLLMRTPDGAVYPSLGIYREIVPPERIVLEGQANDTCPGCGAGLPPGSVVTITFEDVAGERTRLTVETRFPTEAAHRAAVEAGLQTGWTGTLERLGDYVRRCDR